MVNLILAIASSTLISLLMRTGEKKLINNLAMFGANYGVCILLSLFYLKTTTLALTGFHDRFTLLLGFSSGILYLVSFLFLQFNIQRNGVVLSATFMKLGVLVPTVMATVIFKETPKALQILGILIALAAIILINYGKRDEKKEVQGLFLILLLIMGGFTDSLANIFDKCGQTANKDSYLLFTFATAFLLCVISTVVKKKPVVFSDIVLGILIGIPNYYSARFLLLSLGSLPAIVVYPVYNVAVILLVALAGVLIFHESISRKKQVGLFLILLSLVAINLA